MNEKNTCFLISPIVMLPKLTFCIILEPPGIAKKEELIVKVVISGERILRVCWGGFYCFLRSWKRVKTGCGS